MEIITKILILLATKKIFVFEIFYTDFEYQDHN